MYFNNSDYEQVCARPGARECNDMSSANLSQVPQLPANEHDDVSPRSPSRPFPPGHPVADRTSLPDSPPPSFRSRASSRRNSTEHSRHHNEDQDRNLDDAFASPSDDESDADEEITSSRRLIRNDRSRSNNSRSVSETSRSTMDRRVTEINMFMPPAGGSDAAVGGRVYGGGQGGAPQGGGQGTRDGVFANISAKPTAGEDLEEKPPVCPPFFW